MMTFLQNWICKGAQLSDKGDWGREQSARYRQNVGIGLQFQCLWGTVTCNIP